VAKRRHFGNVRQRASGRWQVRYRGPDGRMRAAPETFARKAEAQRYLTLVEAQIARGDWTDPERAKVTVGDYAERWITERAGLRPRTVELYRWLLRRHVTPWLGGVPLGKIDTPMVREWRAKLLAEGVSQSTTAKAYRFLRSVLMTATSEDRIIPRNPCQVRGADREQPAERPVLEVAQVVSLADAMPARFRAMILLATFASLRFGEVTALERRDIDVAARTVRVRRTFVEVRGKGLVPGPPKSHAGRRTVTVPPTVAEAMRDHLAEYVGNDPTALVFTGPRGGPIWRGNFRKLTAWTKTVAGLGLAGVHFHDLRHTGNTLAARSGVSTRDLMARMGHDSVRAAIIYQHATTEADARIAASLEASLTAADDGQADEDDGPEDDDDGAAGAPVPAG
jgi:integrase